MNAPNRFELEEKAEGNRPSPSRALPGCSNLHRSLKGRGFSARGGEQDRGAPTSEFALVPQVEVADGHAPRTKCLLGNVTRLMPVVASKILAKEEVNVAVTEKLREVVENTLGSAVKVPSTSSKIAKRALAALPD